MCAAAANNSALRMICILTSLCEGYQFYKRLDFSNVVEAELWVHLASNLGSLGLVLGFDVYSQLKCAACKDRLKVFHPWYPLPLSVLTVYGIHAAASTSYLQDSS